MTDRALDHQQYRFKSEKVTVKAHFRRIRRPAATAPTPHRRSEQAPQPPHAAPASSPAESYTDGHDYLPSTVPWLRSCAEDRLRRMADAQTKIDELYDWIARWSAEADELFFLAAAVEFDALPAPDASVRPGPAMGTDQLVNGVQPDFDRPPMQSTDPDTPHLWRVTFFPENGEPWTPIQHEMTDAEIERLSEESGEIGSITYAREIPWQDGRRHATRLEAPWAPVGPGIAVYERIYESSLTPISEASAAGWDDPLPATQDPAAAETLTMHAVDGAR